MRHYVKLERKAPVCLKCGDKIRYGRSDKKFCCEDCRVSYNNEVARSGRGYRRRVLKILLKNYDILEGIMKDGLTTVDLVDLASMGFVPGIVTSYHKVRGHNEYACFDIKFKMTESRIYGITKISLNLQIGKTDK